MTGAPEPPAQSQDVQPTPGRAGSFATPRKPVILQVLPALEQGGVERGAIEMAEALVKAGAVALVASAGGRLAHELARVGAEHVTLPLATKNPLAIRRNRGRLLRLIRERGVDLVHARSRAPAWSALGAARDAGIPFVTTFHGTYGHGNPLKRWYNRVMLKGDRVIAISAFIARHVQETYGFAAESLRVIPRGVDLRSFDPERTSAARVVELAQRWRIPDGVPVVMLPARLTAWKGHEVLIDALAALPELTAAGGGEPALRCLLVGADQGRKGYRARLEAQIARRGLGAVVQIVDDCRDMPAAYMLADVVVSASTVPEAFGRVMAEAGAMGKPVIASRHGAAPEIVLEGKTGWLVPPGDAGALADALRAALLLRAEARATLAAAAIAHIRSRFSRDLMCDRTLDVYEELLAPRWGGEGR